jgi:putative spermidine/putrescine transport system permease protein
MVGVGRAPWALAAPLGLAYAAFFVAPLLMLFAVSFYADERLTRLGLDQWRRFLFDAFHWKVVADTVLLGLKTVAATVLLGLPLALVYRAASAFWQRVLLFVVVMPLLTSVVVRTFAWIVILGREGVVNRLVLDLGLAAEPLRLLQTEYGLVISLTQIEMPLLLLPLLSVMARIEPNLVDASAALGASPWRTLFRVILPLAAPGLAAGCLLVFASSTTAFISQGVIGGGRLVYLPALIWQQAMVVANWPFAATAAIALLASVSAVIAVIAQLGRLSAGRAHG